MIKSIEYSKLEKILVKLIDECYLNNLTLLFDYNTYFYNFIKIDNLLVYKTISNKITNTIVFHNMSSNTIIIDNLKLKYGQTSFNVTDKKFYILDFKDDFEKRIPKLTKLRNLK